MKRVEWSRVSVEGAVIVGSILLAFGIQAWWDDRVERAAVAAALGDVVVEVENGRVELVSAIETNLDRVTLMQEFLNLSPAEVRALPEDSLDVISASFLPPRTFDGGGSALSGLLAAGRLSLIPDAEVRAALVEWGRLPDEIDEDYAITTSVALTLQELAAERGLYFAIDSYLRDEPYPGARSMAEAMGALRDDGRFVGVLARLAGEYLFFVEELRSGLALADRVLSVTGER